MVTVENGVIKPKGEIQSLSFIRADELDVMQLEKPFLLSKRCCRWTCVSLLRRPNMESHDLSWICVYL